jgi:hypothetical protein
MAIAEISTALATLKAATDIGKAIIGAGNAIEVAQLRLQLADMMGSLAEARIALVDAQEVTTNLQSEIGRLNGALEAKQKVVKLHDAYYETNEAGAAAGEGYCMRCWEVSHKLRHLAYPRNTNMPAVCPDCKSQYTYQRTRRQE